MPEHLSSASRLYRILQQGAALPENTATLKAWALLFHLEEPYEVKLSIDVSERLLWLNQELEMLTQQLKRYEADEDSCAEALTHIEQALSPVYLPTNWGNVRQFLSAETLDCLASWINVLPDDETPVGQEELDATRRRADELEKLLASSTLVEELKLLISRHLKLIRKALAGYPLIGIRALKTGVFSGLGELVYIEKTINENCDRREVRDLISVWKKISELADGAMKGEGGVVDSPWTALCPFP